MWGSPGAPAPRLRLAGEASGFRVKGLGFRPGFRLSCCYRAGVELETGIDSLRVSPKATKTQVIFLALVLIHFARLDVHLSVSTINCISASHTLELENVSKGKLAA